MFNKIILVMKKHILFSFSILLIKNNNCLLEVLFKVLVLVHGRDLNLLSYYSCSPAMR